MVKNLFHPNLCPLCSLKNSDKVEEVIKEQVTKGYDFIKTYHMLSNQNFQDIMKVAEKYNIISLVVISNTRLDYL